MNRLVPIAGWLIFLGAGMEFLEGYGIRWEVGPYLMPASLVASDGFHYYDGSDIDPITLALVDSGCEQPVELALCVFLFLALVWLQTETRKLRRRQCESRRHVAGDSKWR